MRALPGGTVTLVFTDIEGSTALLHELGAERYEELLAEHRRLVRRAVERHGGTEVDAQGDAFFLAFADAGAAVTAAAELQRELGDGPIRVRAGVHTGTPRKTAEGYVGSDVHLAARLCGAGHGGQVLLSAATRAVVDVGLIELGEHRLKDFADPVLVFQLGADSFPPLRTISNTNLPRPASSFVGRAREVVEVSALLTNGARLVTLTGPGGSGKTRLAIEAASDLITAFKAGVFWVPLAPIDDPALVMQTIGATVGAKGELSSHVGERDMLLVLDNLEQVVVAAPDIAGLLEACPRLRVLATSRERLRVRGEVAYPVAPLPDAAALELFASRSGLPADATIARLCAALENLPLAIELAAARADVLSPPQILARVGQRLDLLKGGRDADPRQQTLRATIEWSHDLLNEPEQQLFRRLAVFRGGCTLEAAEAVADADLDTLQSLLDKSLLRRADGRLLMLETIRHYAAERLEESGEHDAQRGRHLAFFRDLADDAFEAENEHEILAQETDNLRLAIDWAATTGRALDELAVTSAVAYFWLEAGRATEAHDRLAAALGRRATSGSLRARALAMLGYVELVQGAQSAESTLREAVRVSTDCGDLRWQSQALDSIAHLLMDTDLAAAREALERSVALRRQAGRPREHAESMGSLCLLLLAEGDAAGAERVAREVLELAERQGQLELSQTARRSLADASLVAGDVDEAHRRFLRALEHAQRHRLARLRTGPMWGIAITLAARGADARAVRIAAANARQRVAYGLPPLSPTKWWRELIERHLGEARARLSASELAEAEQAGAEVDYEALVDEVLAEAPDQD